MATYEAKKGASTVRTLDPALVARLCCPVCIERPPLRLSQNGDYLLCARCARAYPISPEGIPFLVPDAARTDYSE